MIGYKDSSDSVDAYLPSGDYLHKPRPKRLFVFFSFGCVFPRPYT